MNGGRRLTTFPCVAILAVAAAYAESDGSGENSGRFTGAPPTHQGQSIEEALIFGTLDGALDCVWIEVRQERLALTGRHPPRPAPRRPPPAGHGHRRERVNCNR